MMKVINCSDNLSAAQYTTKEDAKHRRNPPKNTDEVSISEAHAFDFPPGADFTRSVYCESAYEMLSKVIVTASCQKSKLRLAQDTMIMPTQ